MYTLIKELTMLHQIGRTIGKLMNNGHFADHSAQIDDVTYFGQEKLLGVTYFSQMCLGAMLKPLDMRFLCVRTQPYYFRKPVLLSLKCAKVSRNSRTRNSPRLIDIQI